jgi:dTDP-4-dehydrorhamnose reductase
MEWTEAYMNRDTGDERQGKESMLQEQRILVVGSSGYLGRVVTKILVPKHFVVPTHDKHPYFPGSVRYSFPHDDLGYLIKANTVDTCIFAAEIEKKQDYSESDDLGFFHEAVEKLVRSLSVVRCVYVSSDGIFDGEHGSYAESDIPHPTTEYGQRLRICEDSIRTLCTNYCIIRPSYLYGHSLGILDKRLQRTRRLCQSQQEAIYFQDMFKSPLHVVDAANLIITLAASEYIGVIHIGGSRMSVYDFHKEAMAAIGVSGRISPIEMPTDTGLLRDTSLDTSLCAKLTGFIPRSVTESLRQYSEKQTRLERR